MYFVRLSKHLDENQTWCQMLLCNSRMCCLEKAGFGRPPPPTWYQRYALPINEIMFKQNVGVKQISLNKGILHFLCFNGGVYSGQLTKLPQPSLKSFEILSCFCGLFRSHLSFCKGMTKRRFYRCIYCTYYFVNKYAYM